VIAQEVPRHDLALVLEPGIDGPAVVMARKGVGIWHFCVDGIEAHAGVEPEKGANALVEMARKILDLTALADPALGTTVNPGVIAGGTKPYVVPGECRLEVDIRVPSAAEQARVEAGLRAIAASCTVPGTRTRLAGSFHRPPMESGDAARAYLARLQASAALVGFPLGSGATGGASDGNLTSAAGLATIDGLGPHGGRAHSPDEFLELPTLGLTCQILANFLASLGR
jgi:glutamate carboxypeptidase